MLDRFADMRDTLAAIAAHTGEWAGLPCPIEGERLVIEPSYPFAEVLTSKAESDEDDGWRVRNQWYSRQQRCHIILMERDGNLDWGRAAAFHHLGHSLKTLGCSVAWGIEQEDKAIDLLGTMLLHNMFKSYLMTGMFLETSARSGVSYLFRRLKPTVALSARGDELRVIAALCMHPIAYYAGSWAGAMCPTDDVIAHLAMMRGDEHMFWKRCNQHPAYRQEAGL